MRGPLIEAISGNLPCRMDCCPPTSFCRCAVVNAGDGLEKWSNHGFVHLVGRAFSKLSPSEPWLQLLVDNFNEGRALLWQQAQEDPRALNFEDGRDLIDRYGYYALLSLPQEFQDRANRDLNRGPAVGAPFIRGHCYAEQLQCNCLSSHVKRETLRIFSRYGFWNLELTAGELEDAEHCEDADRRIIAVNDSDML